MKTIKFKLKKEDLPKRRSGVKPSKVMKDKTKYTRKKKFQ